MRLDKFLALQGLGTRSEMRALVRAGRVRVNGKPTADAGLAIREGQDEILLDGEALVHQDAMHIMVNKPVGILTAAHDPRHRTIMDILPPRLSSMDCMPVGRLDLDAEGLLLLTTDGQLAHRLLSPKRHVDKVYYVELDGPVDASDADAFSAGLVLSDFTALPASLEILQDATSAKVTVQEGKFHQVKRMFLARGKTVLRLKRLSFGGIALDPALAPGEWRALTDEEHTQLVKAAGGPFDG